MFLVYVMLFGLWWENLSTYAGFSSFGLSKGVEWDRDRVQKISFRVHITCSLLIGSFVRLVEFYFGVFRNERSFAFFCILFVSFIHFLFIETINLRKWFHRCQNRFFFWRKLCSHCNRSFSVISRSKCGIIYHRKLFGIFLFCIAMWGVYKMQCERYGKEINLDAKGHANQNANYMFAIFDIRAAKVY